MCVEVHEIVRFAVGRPLVEAQAVGKAGLKEVVVARGHCLQNRRETAALCRREVGEATQVAARQHQRLKGPRRPERDDRDKMVVLGHHALRLRQLGRRIVAEQATVVFLPVLLLRGQLAQRLVRDVLCGPYLAVGMGIAGAHHCPAVLEDLHMVDIR